MKRIDLIRHLESQGCQFMREGKQPSLYINRQTENPPRAASSRDSPGNSSKHVPRSWNSVAVLKHFGICADPITYSNNVDKAFAAHLLSTTSLESQAFNFIKQLDEVAFAFVFDA